MPVCPVCGKNNNTLVCESCGFDGSCDYEKYPSLDQIAHGTDAISRRCAVLKEKNAAMRCPKCGGTQFTVIMGAKEYLCGGCSHRIPMDGISQNPEPEKPAEVPVRKPQPKKRSKMPWILAAAAVLIIGVIAVLSLFGSKPNGTPPSGQGPQVSATQPAATRPVQNPPVQSQPPATNTVITEDCYHTWNKSEDETLFVENLGNIPHAPCYKTCSRCGMVVRLTKAQHASGYYTEYQYNESGQLSFVADCWVDGTYVNHQFRYNYDENGRLASREQYGMDSSNAFDLAFVDSYVYDESGKLLVKTEYIVPNDHFEVIVFEYGTHGKVVSGESLSNEEKYEYNEKAYLTRYTRYNLGNDIHDWDYEYDARDNMIRRNVYNDGLVNCYFLYEYDDGGNLIKETQYSPSGEQNVSIVYIYEPIETNE